MLKYGKYVEYVIFLEICIYMQQKFFSMHTLLNKPNIFYTHITAYFQKQYADA